MSKRRFPCRECGDLLEERGLVAEEALVPSYSPDGVIINVARNFRILCPAHGLQIHQEPTGHHSTLNEKLARDVFPQATRKFVRSQLSPEDRRRFDKFYKGKAIPSPEDYQRWKAIAATFNPPATAP